MPLPKMIPVLGGGCPPVLGMVARYARAPPLSHVLTAHLHASSHQFSGWRPPFFGMVARCAPPIGRSHCRAQACDRPPASSWVWSPASFRVGRPHQFLGWLPASCWVGALCKLKLSCLLSRLEPREKGFMLVRV